MGSRRKMNERAAETENGRRTDLDEMLTLSLEG